MLRGSPSKRARYAGDFVPSNGGSTYVTSGFFVPHSQGTKKASEPSRAVRRARTPSALGACATISPLSCSIGMGYAVSSIMKFGRRRILVLTLAAATGLPLHTSACEPIVPLTKLMSGATLAGPGLILQSLTWLCIAVVINTGSFALLEPRLSTTRAIALMLAANVLSTIPGLLTAAFAGSFSLLTLPIVFL